MMGSSPQCYIPSLVKIGQPVLEKKIFEGFLPYMGVVAILVIYEQTFVHPTQGGSTENLASIGQVVLEKMFEIVYDDDDGWTPDHEFPISSPMSLWLR